MNIIPKRRPITGRFRYVKDRLSKNGTLIWKLKYVPIRLAAERNFYNANNNRFYK